MNQSRKLLFSLLLIGLVMGGILAVGIPWLLEGTLVLRWDVVALCVGAGLLSAGLGHASFRLLIGRAIRQHAKQLRLLVPGKPAMDVPSKGKDAVEDLGEAIHSFSLQYRSIVDEMRQSNRSLGQLTEQAVSCLQETAGMSNALSEVIGEVAGGSEKQLCHIQAGQTVLHDVNQTIGRITENAQVVSASAAEASRMAQAGNAEVEKALAQMQAIDKTISKLASVITELEKRSQHIGEVISAITGIAQQTNLLALNASIESARAGEHGRGFAVVADEVRKLAEQSSESAQQIAEYITLIQKDIQDVSASMVAGRKEVEAGVSVVQSVGDTFGHIQQTVAQVAEQIRCVYDAAMEMSNSTQLTDTIRSIREVAVTQADASNSVKEAVARQSQSWERLHQSVISLMEKIRDTEQRWKRY